MPRKLLNLRAKQLTKLLNAERRLPQFKKNQTLTVVFLNPGAAKRLNLRYRQKDYPTDVLSFEGLEPDSLGELIMCPQVLKKQARHNGHSFQDELTYMLIHGVLHLLGLDHERSSRQAKLMFAIQDELFRRVLGA